MAKKRRSYSLLKKTVLHKSDLINKHITRFGTPIVDPVVSYFVTDDEGLIQMDIDLEHSQLRAKGVQLTPEVFLRVKENIENKRTQFHNQVNQLGVPDKFRDLFSFTKKKQVEQYCRELEISEYDLFLLIHNCSQMQFSHRAKFKQYVPEHLTITNRDKEQMDNGNPESFLKKTDATLMQRRRVHVHLFEYSSFWHCFYFDYNDIEPNDANSWEYGCHLHYVSHLWVNLKKRWVWSHFNQRSTEMPGKLHIRFKTFEFPKYDTVDTNQLSSQGTLQPWAVAFNPKFAAGCGSIALPVAFMATRGIWAAQMSMRPTK